MPIRSVPHSQVLSTPVANKAIRNTYTLLSMTLVFSAVCAAISTSMQVGLHPLLNLVIMIGLLFAIQWQRNSVIALPLTFAFTGFAGFTLGPVLNMYLAMANGGEIIMTALGLTGIIFAGLSAYALTTRKDFSFMRGFLLVGILAVVGAGIANMFLHMPGLQLAIAAAAVIVFSGFILYDTSNMIHSGETNYVLMTVSQFLNILNLFTALLQLVGAFSSDD
ncbi:Bax inhibitor-1/YccA family protein [Pokkaliibacter sp. MBI-7]|uniref:Bax inhibitor-1/YccA family protein n=1 Tax=Pokkaliibacter sp. MBI-7 TaxID=3040600 RepID=UPI0024481A8E|nr:Bax inhibitor-1/YccA family protein [Pokkaliibacter sp. MBI-7]MDH2436500.1 Bax inhibitor-1/YccA family protein [Pokkaliibacter sp. MBI-7]